MGQGFQLLLQFFLLACYQTGLCQLLQLETDIILFLPVLTSLFFQLFQLPLQGLITPVFLAVQDQKYFVFSHYIDHFQLETVISQQQILMLRMDIDQTASKLLHYGKRNR